MGKNCGSLQNSGELWEKLQKLRKNVEIAENCGNLRKNCGPQSPCTSNRGLKNKSTKAFFFFRACSKINHSF